MIRHKTGRVPTVFRAAGCFCLHRGQVLIMERQAGKPYGLHWGVPTGKIEQGETPREAMLRELNEEIGLLARPEKLVQLATYVVEDRGSAFEYVSFVLELSSEPQLRLHSAEVRQALWMSIKSGDERPFVPFFYNTMRDLLEWINTGAVQLRPAAEAQSTSIDTLPQ